MKMVFLLMATILVSANCMAGELPVVSVFDLSGQPIIDADTAHFEGKFGVWTFFDSENCRAVEAKAGDVTVSNMNGEYIVRNGQVYHLNTATKKEFRLTSDTFGEVTITKCDDDFVVNNEL